MDMTSTVIFLAILSTPPTIPEVAHRIVSGDARADYDGNGRVDGCDLASCVEALTTPRPGYYSMTALRTARAHPQLTALRDAHSQWITKYLQGIANAPEPKLPDLISGALISAEFDWIDGQCKYEAERRKCCERIAAIWPGGLSAHQQTSSNPRQAIIDLCKVASLAPETKPVLQSVLETCLVQLKDGNIPGTNIGRTLACRTAIARTMGISLSPFEDYGRDRGLSYLLTQVHPSGWPNWDVASLWYVIFCSRAALVYVGWDHRHEMTTDEHARFMALYRLPWTTLCNGASPVVGEDFSELRIKPYKVWAGWHCNTPGMDPDSLWLRHALAATWSDLTFDDLTVTPLTGNQPPYPRAADGTRTFGAGRVTINRADGRYLVTFWSNAPTIVGGHTYDGRVPQVTIVDADGSMEFRP